MNRAKGIIIEVKPYLAGRLEGWQYMTMNSSRCAIIKVQTDEGERVLDMLLAGVMPEVGNHIDVELDDEGDFGILMPEEIEK